MAGKSDVYLCFIPCYHMTFVEHNAVCPRKGDDVDVYMCMHFPEYMYLTGSLWVKVFKGNLRGENKSGFSHGE